MKEEMILKIFNKNKLYSIKKKVMKMLRIQLTNSLLKKSLYFPILTKKMTKDF